MQCDASRVGIEARGNELLITDCTIGKKKWVRKQMTRG